MYKTKAGHLIDDLPCALHGSGRGHGDGAEQGAGVLAGHQTCLGGLHRDAQCQDADQYDNTDGQGLAHEFLHTGLVSVEHLVIRSIESGMETVNA